MYNERHTVETCLQTKRASYLKEVCATECCRRKSSAGRWMYGYGGQRHWMGGLTGNGDGTILPTSLMKERAGFSRFETITSCGVLISLCCE